MRKWLLVYGCGSFAALLVTLAQWLLAKFGVYYELGADLSPSISAVGLYPKMVWGGVCGFLILMPLTASRWLLRSVWVALIPALIQLFVIYPVMTSFGVAGLALGVLTPGVVFLFFWAWALLALTLYRF
ncbi:hypothetical protein KO507_14660 [Gilvimarinus agarilyticus]|uniref:hypothetical protein n=1 Tax=Gilvimarinus sp. 2_MG-2023 TaxID=3062666 RepID=UPI001C08F1B5|nr:hypothetical protein [Gilvimarinus sp. 2_MG-2023]MBU2887009.1 hypothetical protein [Gilvimarinus agarilyticus]MDO6571669.1 hypothetical protein [Gilvimarinus sp. 2_MG-2023]